jgi:hypothetical protein
LIPFKHTWSLPFLALGSRKASRKIEPGERLLTPILCNVVAQHFTCQQLFWAYAVQCSGSPHALGRRLRRCNARAQQGQSRDPWNGNRNSLGDPFPPTTDLVPQSLHSVSQYSLRLLWKMQLYPNEHCPACKLRANGSIGASLWPLKIPKARKPITILEVSAVGWPACSHSSRRSLHS